MSLNFRLATLISFINVAYRSRLVFLEIAYCDLYLRILYILWQHRIIGFFCVHGNKITIRFLFFLGNAPFTTLKVISTPSYRKYLSLSKLALTHHKSNFGGFLILSTAAGFITNSQAILSYKLSGEILILASF